MNTVDFQFLRTLYPELEPIRRLQETLCLAMPLLQPLNPLEQAFEQVRRFKELCYPTGPLEEVSKLFRSIDYEYRQLQAIQMAVPRMSLQLPSFTHIPMYGFSRERFLRHIRSQEQPIPPQKRRIGFWPDRD